MENNEKIPASPIPGAQGNPLEKKKRWLILSLLIAIASIWAVTSQWKDFSLNTFIDYVSRADMKWLLAAFMGMFGFIFFEACALRSACFALHYHPSLRGSFTYAAADIYFSAITPSASGGQPVCALLMMRDGIPGIVCTAALLLTLSMYAMAILVIGVFCLILRPWVFMSFGWPGRILIVIGFIAQLGLALFFLLLIRSESLLERLCRGVIRLLSKLRLLRNASSRLEKLEHTMEEYRGCITLLGGPRTLMLRSLCFNLLQRASVISVSMSAYMAMGGSLSHALDVFSMQGYVVIGSNCVPVPGAMGVADYLMLDGFQAFLAPDQVAAMELLSRSISFYCCVLLCGITVLLAYFLRRKVGKR
jgi:uncharacterized protein (TIRG00374 family)